jgi:hypothetical protein
VLAAAVCFGFPVAYIVAPAVIAGRDADKGLAVLWVCVAIGVLGVVTSLGLSIWALVVAKRGEGGRKTLAILAMVLAALSPFTGAGSIFFSILLMGGGPSGRPLRDRRGRPRTAPTIQSDDWSAHLAPRLDHLDADERRQLGELWLEDARNEHASIAAFGRLALDLLALGAPAELVTRTHAAALEEVEHARLTFSLASAYLGAPVSPGAFADAAAPHSASLGARAERVAFECVIDGDLGEGIAARAAAIAARRDELDPVVGAVLEIISRDEASHAELAREIVAWLLSHPALFASAERGARRGAEALRPLTRILPDRSVEPALPGRISRATLDGIRREEAIRVLATLDSPAADRDDGPTATARSAA